MKKSSGRKVKKMIAKKASQIKATVKRAKKKTNKAKNKSNGLLKKAKRKLSKLTKKSSQSIHHATDKIHATEEEILHYVKENPVKSISAVTLAAVIAGFVASRYKK